MQQLENDLDQTQEKLMNANQRLEEKEKALQNVSLKKLRSITNQIFLSSTFYVKPQINSHKNGIFRGM